MTDESIKETIAPCGLCCETCFAHVNGDIRKLSIQLKEKLGNTVPILVSVPYTNTISPIGLKINLNTATSRRRSC